MSKPPRYEVIFIPKYESTFIRDNKTKEVITPETESTKAECIELNRKYEDDLLYLDQIIGYHLTKCRIDDAAG